MRPKLRPLETNWVQHNGRMALLLRDRLGLTENAVIVPATLALLLSLCDGTRDENALRVSFELRSGMRIDALLLRQLLRQLDEALLLEGPRVEAAREAALREYREAPFRSPALAGQSYPSDPVDLTRFLEGFSSSPNDDPAPGAVAEVRGLISPHIDFQRGGHVYSKVWRRAADTVAKAEVVVIFGTDHLGGPLINPTRQHYATPWGILPTATRAIDALIAALGDGKDRPEELHHKNEHSIESALVWLHHILGGRSVEIVPILCGSFQPFTEGEADPAQSQELAVAVDVLREVIAGRRHLVVAAADLAHVGPAFGDPASLGTADKALLSTQDTELLTAACSGDAETFFAPLRAERDRRRICGLPPIYLAMRLLGPGKGEVVDYAQCPADADGGSIVSIAGVLFY